MVCLVLYTRVMTNNLPAGNTSRKEPIMASKFFSVSVLGSNVESAINRVARCVGKVDGFELTGKFVKSQLAGHNQLRFEVADLGGNRNDLWVVLSSYGISLDKGVSHWQNVPGVGKAVA
jgi:hypothetical protein